MTTIQRILTGGFVAALAVGLYMQTDARVQKAGAKAPDFKATGSDGKSYTLKSFTGSKKPTVFYFIGATCPVNAEAVKYYNRVAEAYKGKINFVGVINANKEEYKTWQQRFKAPYLVLLDPDLKIINSFEAERSPWTILVDTNGKMTKTWVGYSVDEINQLSASIAGATKVTVAKVNTSGAPTSPRAG
ncbi:MAG: peroxiredoxin family protein [Fimbriimonadaceae bacterium]|nr:peroxiredoxin family protein [Fimbriimonadaceae bacterium]